MKKRAEVDSVLSAAGVHLLQLRLFMNGDEKTAGEARKGFCVQAESGLTGEALR